MKTASYLRVGLFFFISFILIAMLFLQTSFAGAGDSLAQGKKAFESKCGRCHSLTKALTGIQTKPEWKKTVKKMVAYGAGLNRKERKNVVQYLSTRSLFDRSCSLCHELSQVVTDDSATRNWQKTIEEMGDHFKDVEFKKKVVGKQPPTKKEQKEIVQLLKLLLSE